ncbi:MAG: CD225/dispanin family protein [Planctomycetota bacterium]
MNQHNNWEDEGQDNLGGFDPAEPTTPPVTQTQYAQPAPHRQYNHKADDNLVFAILMMLFCCQPLGIVAIIFSALAMSANNSGDFDTAHRQAAISKKCCAWGLGLGLAYILFIVVIMVLSMAASV